MNNSEEPRWYIFYCRSRSEKKVFEALIQSNYQAYLPLIEVMRQWSDRKKKVKVPMLTGYIFVFCKFGEIYSIIQTENIVSSVKIGGTNLYLREHEIELLKKIEKNDLFESISPAKFSVGDKVIVSDGLLKGYEGDLIRINGKHTFQIQIEGLDQLINIKIPIEYLKKK